MDPVVHFEMPYDDRDRMARFYRSAFDWDTTGLGSDMGNYALATTTECDNARPKEPGAINGGFYKRNPEWPAQHPSIVIAVGNMCEAMSRVTDAGGHVLGEPMQIAGVGLYGSFYDSEGNRVSMLEPLSTE